MEIQKMCRCCLRQGAHKDLNTAYTYLNKKEIYADMLLECFNIILNTSQCNTNVICDLCISSLRSSHSFKQQVLDAENVFLASLQNVEPEEKPFPVKLEPKGDSGDDSDDYFLAELPSVKELPDEKIKVEFTETKKITSQKRSKQPGNKKRKERDGWKKEKIKSLVTRLATSINSSYDFPELTITKRKQNESRRHCTIKISNAPKEAINVAWSSKANTEKTKHKLNLLTILKYSNATPFKNKSLLGFICGYCDATFPDPIDLKTHTNISHKIERLEFKSNFDLTEYNVKVDITDLICTLCDEPMKDLGILKEHLVKSHNQTIYNDIKDHILQFKLKKGEVYNCAMCTATYETFKMLKQHMNKHYNNYTCHKCNASFATKRSLSAHKTTHIEGSFKCDHCDKVFASNAKKHYHEKTKHMGARSISNCPFCNESFRSYYQRNQHLIKVHNTEAQYKCNVCDKAYILKSLLMSHIKKNHLMEKNCQCTECGFRFFSKKALKAHMVKHTGEKNFSCEVCHKAYARKYTLREHMRIHNNDRRFKCEVCAMSFVQKCSLKSHLLSNHGISLAASDITTSGGV